MLSRFASVSPSNNGTYLRPPSSKLSFGGMLYIRAQMISSLADVLAKGVTIATRYLHQRRQFADPELREGEKGFGVEKQVILYPSTYMRIIPHVVNAIVFSTVGKSMVRSLAFSLPFFFLEPILSRSPPLSPLSAARPLRPSLRRTRQRFHLFPRRKPRRLLRPKGLRLFPRR
jgi:hypothetical protein